ncbi:MAG TPA: response regulator transcription factor [Bacilli bacterium]|nr:response regulator transcription factor [Bacilli bacterium]
MKKIRILLVDDHELFRRGVRSILEEDEEFEVIGEAADGVQGLEKAHELMPDVILMDINMPRSNGLETTKRIKTELPYVKILILTVSDAEQNLYEAVKHGTQGYLLKNVDPLQLIDSVKKVAMGEAVIPGFLAVKILSEFAKGEKKDPTPAVDPLSQRELEVLRELSTGASNKEIAGKLFISENTVRNHIRNILDKLHLQNRVQAAAYAVREGIVPEEDKE